MRIAVCGSGTILNRDTAEKSIIIGEEIAKHKCTLLTGGCHGYPNEVARAAFGMKGKVIAYSPAKDKKEHKEKYGFPTENFNEIIYTGKGIPERNIDLIKNSDSVIIIDGKVGTLNEFTLAFHYNKTIGVLTNSGGISDLISKIAEAIDKNGEKDKIIYEKEPKRLVEKIINVVKE